jgi:hypothetical protein
MSTAESLLDEFLREEDVASRHSTLIHAEPDVIYSTLNTVRFSDSPIIRWLFRLRGLRSSPGGLSGLSGSGFIPLADRPGEAIALGIVGRFWTPTGQVRRLRPEEFRDYHEPGTAKGVWVFVIEPVEPGVCRVVTSTRVACADAASRRRFRFYWLLVGPFSGLIRREGLRLIKRSAEAASSSR